MYCACRQIYVAQRSFKERLFRDAISALLLGLSGGLIEGFGANPDGHGV